MQKLLQDLQRSQVYLLEYASVNSKCYADQKHVNPNDVCTDEQGNENEDDDGTGW